MSPLAGLLLAGCTVSTHGELFVQDEGGAGTSAAGSDGIAGGTSPAGAGGAADRDATVGTGGASGSSVVRRDAGGLRFPLKASANGRYLTDQNGAPFLVAGDAPQCLTARLSPDDMKTYFSMRAKQGFNAAWVNILCTTYTGGSPDATTFDGVAPFSGKIGSDHDLGQPNPAYFSRVDAAVNAAANEDIVLFLDPIETGGFLTTLRANGAAAARAYGRYLGQRYANTDNIVWLHGNSFSGWSSPSDDSLVQGVALGIRDMDTRHLQTLEINTPNSSLDAAADWFSDEFPILGLNSAQTRSPTYAQLLKDYNRPTFLPNVMIEGNYEGENHSNGPRLANAYDCRAQYYWSNLSGATGSLYGNHFIWGFASTWQQHMGDLGGTQVAYVQALFLPRPWQDLVPDQHNVVVVSGLGNYSETGSAMDNTHATAAMTPSGSLVVTYMPTARTVGVDMTKLAASAVARWFDPTTGKLTPITGSPFPNLGMTEFTPPTMKHADGYDDWVLILETTPPP